MIDLLEDIVPADEAPKRRWTDHFHERRGADSVEVRRTASIEYRNNGNGYVKTKAYSHVCASCGTEFDSNRRQLPGKKMWCGSAACKKFAAAERARDYRERKGS